MGADERVRNRRTLIGRLHRELVVCVFARDISGGGKEAVRVLVCFLPFSEEKEEPTRRLVALCSSSTRTRSSSTNNKFFVGRVRESSLAIVDTTLLFSLKTSEG